MIPFSFSSSIDADLAFIDSLDYSFLLCITSASWQLLHGRCCMEKEVFLALARYPVDSLLEKIEKEQ
jgi:hypothetical protein